MQYTRLGNTNLKVSRLGFAAADEIGRALLHSSTALTTRIRRLFAWTGARDATPMRPLWLCGISVAAVLICLVTSYNTMLGSMHELTEWLVR